MKQHDTPVGFWLADLGKQLEVTKKQATRQLRKNRYFGPGSYLKKRLRRAGSDCFPDVWQQFGPGFCWWGEVLSVIVNCPVWRLRRPGSGDFVLTSLWCFRLSPSPSETGLFPLAFPLSKPIEFLSPSGLTDRFAHHQLKNRFFQNSQIFEICRKISKFSKFFKSWSATSARLVAHRSKLGLRKFKKWKTPDFC